MRSTRRGVLGGLALFALVPALPRSDGAAPRIVPPRELIFPTDLPTMAITSAGDEVTELGRQHVRFDPVPGRPGRYASQGARFAARERILITYVGAALFARDGRWVGDVHVEFPNGNPHMLLFPGDTLTLLATQTSREIVVSL